jgi:glycosyltransferase involved in cell wall biosynthesis
VGRFNSFGGSILATLPILIDLENSGHEITFVHWITPDSAITLPEFNSQVSLEGKSLCMKVVTLHQLSRFSDVIIAISELTPTYGCQIAGYLTGTPVIGELQVQLDYWIRDNSSFLHRWLSRLFYPRLTALRCVSHNLKDFAVNKLGIHPSKAFVSPNGFNLGSIQALAKQYQSPYKHHFERPTIILAGRLCRQKRFDRAIRSFFLAKPDLPVGTTLLILGEGELQSTLEELVNHSEFRDSVIFLGFQSNPFSFFSRAECFVLSSDYEGFGRVIVEAMICGCPVIATDCPVGPREILEDGAHGYLVPVDDEQALALAMVAMLNNSELREKFKQKGYQRSLFFDQAKISRDYIQALQSYLKDYSTRT